MSYFNDLIDLISDTSSLGIMLELLLVIICISTIIFILTNNRYISLLLKHQFSISFHTYFLHITLNVFNPNYLYPPFSLIHII